MKFPSTKIALNVRIDRHLNPSRSAHPGRTLAALALAVAAVLATGSVARAANTEYDVINSQTDLTSASTYTTTGTAGTGVGGTPAGAPPSVTSDVTFDSGVAYSPATFTVNSSLTVGSLDDLSATTITIANSASPAADTLTLGGPGNLGDSVPGSAPGDLLFVNAGSILNVNAGTGSNTLGLVLGQTGNFDVGGASTISSVITDGGSGFGITKTGVGTLTLSGPSTFSGGVTINTGTVIAGANSTPFTGAVVSGPLGTGTITLAGGRLAGNNVTEANPLSVTGTTGEITTSGGNFTLNGAVTGSGTFTVGNSFVNGTAASIVFGNNLSGFTGTVNFIGNTVDNIIFNSVLNTTAKFALSGPTANQQIFLNAAGTNIIGELSGTGGRIAAFGSATALEINQTTTTTYGGILGQNGAPALSVIKANTGSLSLTFANNYTGATTITGGILSTGSTGILANGGTASSIGKSTNVAANLVLDGGTLQYANTGAAESTDHLFTIGSNEAGGATGTIDASGANAITFSNTGAIAYGTTGQARTLGLTGTTAGNVLASSIGNNGTGIVGVTKTGVGSWTLTHANTYTGATTVTGGTLSAGSSGAFGSNSAVVLGSTAGTLDISLFNTQIGSLTGGGPTGGNVTLGASTLTVGGDNTSPAAFAGVISSTGSPATSLVKIGTGTLTLTGANTYTGATAINAGTVDLGGSTASGSLNSSSALSLGGGTLNYTTTGGATQTVASTALTAGASAINVSAGNTLNLNAITRSAGSVINFGTTGTITTTTPNSNGIIGGYATIGGTNFAVSNGSGSAITPLTTYNASFPAVTVDTVTTDNDNETDATTLSGPSTINSLTIFDAGNNTLALGSNSLTFTAGGGLLYAGNGSGGGSYTVSGPGVIGAGSTNEFITNVNSGAALTISTQVITSAAAAGSLTKGGGGTLILTANNVYTGPTAVDAGTLQIGNATATTLGGGTYGGAVTDNGALVFNSTAANTLSGVISGTGSLASSGTGGTLTLSNGANTYAGGTTINSGTVVVKASSTPTTGTVTSGPLGTGTITLAGGTLSSDATSRTLANPVSVTASTNTTLTTGGGNLLLNGAFTGSGQITIGQGFSGAQASVGIADSLSGFTGTLNYIGQNTDNLLIQSGTGINTVATFNLSGSTNQQGIILNPGVTDTIGGLSGTGGDMGATGTPTTLVINQSATTTFSGVLGGTISGTARPNINVTKANTGTLNLTGTNAYTGVTAVTGGILSTGSAGILANGGTASSIGKSTNVAGNLVLDGGTLQYANTGAAESTDRLFTVGSNEVSGTTGTIDASGANALSFTNTGAIGYGTTNQPRTLALTGTTAGNVLAPSIGNNGSGVVNLTKLGGGSWTLTNTSAYSGVTTVSGGKLLVSGSLTSTGAVSVGAGATLAVNGLVNTSATITNAGGTLQGQGTVGTVNVTAGGTLAPGFTVVNNNAGTLTAAGTSLDATSNFNIRLGVASLSGTDGDALVGSGGTVTLNGANLNLTLGSTFASAPVGSFYNIIIGGGPLTNSDGFGFSGNNFGNAVPNGSGIGTLTAAGYTFNVIYGSDGTGDGLANQGNDVTLVLQGVPEPQTWAMLLSGVGLLGMWQRSRRRTVIGRV